MNLTNKQKKFSLYALFVVIMFAMSFSHGRNAKKFEKKLQKENIVINKPAVYQKLSREFNAKKSSIIFLGTIALTCIGFAIYGLSKDEETSTEDEDS